MEEMSNEAIGKKRKTQNIRGLGIRNEDLQIIIEENRSLRVSIEKYARCER